MKIRFLGSGAAFNFDLGNTSFLVYDSSENPKPLLLVDCGHTVPAALAKLELLDKVEDIAITHLHADHVGGLVDLGFLAHFSQGRRLRLHLPSVLMAHLLWDNCLRGYMEDIMDENGEPMRASLDTYFEISIARPTRENSHFRNFEVYGRKFSYFDVSHIRGKESYGLVSALAPGHFYYSGDCNEVPKTKELLGHDIIFLDCQFHQTGPGDAHLPYPELVARLDRTIRKKVHLVHLGPGYQHFDPREDGFAGKVMPGDTFEF